MPVGRCSSEISQVRFQCTQKTFLSATGTLKISSENWVTAHVFNLKPRDQGSLARRREGSLYLTLCFYAPRTCFQAWLPWEALASLTKHELRNSLPRYARLSPSWFLSGSLVDRILGHIRDSPRCTNGTG